MNSTYFQVMGMLLW